MQYLVFLTVCSNSRTLTKYMIFFQKVATPLFDLLSQNSHFPLSLDMRIQYRWKACWIRILAVQTVSKFVQ